MHKQKMNLPTDLMNAVQVYFDALYYCDTKLLNKVFHKSSSLFDVDKGKVFVEPIDSFSKDVGGRTSPKSKGQKPEAEILMIDWLSSNCATVKIRIRAHENIFVDHLGFVNGEDGWQIVSKIWHLEKVID
ncbi:nuclear transport factor 2 family protein [Mangrovivirga sp. M17]|uniref:Nuclear transport factor 2 family protein n=1 Tax=Mangrovivirga halotolerans TaxID=2993936 RepID=A0ABT3RPP2_9BACT|nr:nuclear transport factor 2 family protein [Mangrovivirga halotolerans]MCX2743749.1 nuclear transport factor 2 family protein [Mangrovivirga halotolerans]